MLDKNGRRYKNGVKSKPWTATDLNPYIYTIELNGSGVVVGSTAWTTDLSITYNIPDGLVVGVYMYTITFTDDYDNSVTDSIIFTVLDEEGGIPGTSIEIILIMSIGTLAAIIIVKKKNFRSNLA